MITDTYKLFFEENGYCSIKTTIDTVPYSEPYFVRPFLADGSALILDYKRIENGGLGIKFDRRLDQLNFEINSDGDMIVIGEDANNYFISIEGGENHGVTTEGGILYYYNSSVGGGIGTMIIEDTFIIV